MLPRVLIFIQLKVLVDSENIHEAKFSCSYFKTFIVFYPVESAIKLVTRQPNKLRFFKLNILIFSEFITLIILVMHSGPHTGTVTDTSSYKLNIYPANWMVGQRGNRP